MISLEKARRLTELGLVWEPKEGDRFIADYNNGLGPIPTQLVKCKNFGHPYPEYTWLPSLSQLLAEFEKQGWTYNLNNYDGHKVLAGYPNSMVLGPAKWFESSTPNDAAADALAWILQREEKN
jgi:hypothetical protein